MAIPLLLAYGTVWLLFMASPARRSMRSIVFLLLTTPLLAVAAALPMPGSWFVVSATAALWLVGLLDLHDVLAPMPRAELQFDEGLSRIRRRVFRHERDLRSNAWEGVRQEHTRVLEAAIHDAQALRPPSAEWEQLVMGFISALEFDSEVYRGERPPNEDAAAASRARWDAVGQLWSGQRAQRSRFFR